MQTTVSGTNEMSRSTTKTWTGIGPGPDGRPGSRADLADLHDTLFDVRDQDAVLQASKPDQTGD